MTRYVLERRIVVPAPLPETFAFFEDPRNLARITPPWLHFRITTSGGIDMRRGTVIRYQIRWLGIPISWTTTISEYDPPGVFVDEQSSGPYRFWRHRHTFEAVEDGTAVGDRVEYALPLGWAGRLAHALVVRRQLEGIFEYRTRILGEIFRPTAR